MCIVPNHELCDSLDQAVHYHILSILMGVRKFSVWVYTGSFQKQRYHVCELLGDRRGYSNLKEEAVDRIKWRNRFGGDCGPDV
jgi:hypothetical protein